MRIISMQARPASRRRIRTQACSGVAGLAGVSLLGAQMGADISEVFGRFVVLTGAVEEVHAARCDCSAQHASCTFKTDALRTT